MGASEHAVSRPPSLPRAVLRQVNRVAAARARGEVQAVWRKHQEALIAEVADLIAAGHSAETVLRALAERD
jgi:hypothetical protein